MKRICLKILRGAFFIIIEKIIDKKWNWLKVRKG
jgi:hypothetical protein